MNKDAFLGLRTPRSSVLWLLPGSVLASCVRDFVWSTSAQTVLIAFVWISDKIGRKVGPRSSRVGHEWCSACFYLLALYLSSPRSRRSRKVTAYRGPSMRSCGRPCTGLDRALTRHCVSIFVGIGIGGENPSSSVAVAENTEDPGSKSILR